MKVIIEISDALVEELISGLVEMESPLTLDKDLKDSKAVEEIVRDLFIAIIQGQFLYHRRSSAALKAEKSDTSDITTGIAQAKE
jgi:hypothetical protein